MTNKLRPMERLRRLFQSEKARREDDAVSVFLEANDNVDSDEAFDSYFEFIEQDPENADLMRDYNEVWDNLGELQNPPYPTAQDLQKTGGLNFFLKPQMALIAATLVAVIVVSYSVIPGSPGVPLSTIAFSTERGEQRPIVLEDGSTVTLGGASEITVSLTDKERAVTLVTGDSYLDVAPDRNRHFFVRAGNVSARAVGTEFSVDRHGDIITIAVSEGVVEVSAFDSKDTLARLTAGQQMQLSSTNQDNPVISIDVNNIAPWRRGELIFDEETLSHAVTRINRYYDGAIIIDDPRLTQLRTSGNVNMYDPVAWVTGLETVLPLRVIEVGPKTYRLEYKRKNS